MSIPWPVRSSTKVGPPPPLAQQPLSTLSFPSLFALPDTKPLPWLSHDTTYDANADLREVERVLYDPQWLEERLEHFDGELPYVRTRSMFATHVFQQLTWGKICETQSARAVLPFFTRLKSNGINTRPLYDASPLNKILGRPHSPKLPSPAFIIDYAMQFSMAASFDLAGWYSQIPIGPALSNCLGIEVNGTTYQYTTLPQGFSEACWIAETIATRLCSGIEDSVAGIVYDNFLLAAKNDAHLRNLVASFDSNLSSCGVVKNEDKTSLGTSVEYCGLLLDLEHKSFTVTDEWAQKAAAALTQALHLKTWSFKSAFAIFGLCAWYLRVTRIPFCTTRPILSAQRLVGRRVHRGASWSSDFHPAPTLIAIITSVRDTLSKNQHIHWHDPPTLSLDTVIFSDASDWGWGIVLVQNGAVTDVRSGKWSEDEATLDIHIRETIAYRISRTTFPPASLYLVDNTVAVNAICKGHSPRPTLDRHLRSPEVLSTKAMIAWVPTALNIADFPSRNEPLPLSATKPNLLDITKDLRIRPVDWTYAQERA